MSRSLYRLSRTFCESSAFSSCKKKERKQLKKYFTCIFLLILHKIPYHSIVSRETRLLYVLLLVQVQQDNCSPPLQPLRLVRWRNSFPHLFSRISHTGNVRYRDLLFSLKMNCQSITFIYTCSEIMLM